MPCSPAGARARGQPSRTPASASTTRCRTRTTDLSHGTTYIHQALEPFGLGDRWSFVNYDGTWHGAPRERVRQWCADADLFIDLSGGSWFWRDEYAAIPRKVFIDSDPVFTQLALAKGDAWYVDFFRRFDHLFTFGANIGTPACDVPTGGFTWHHTWQPVVMEEWATTMAPGDRFTTVMTWRIESFTDVDGNKDRGSFASSTCRRGRRAASAWP